MFRSWIIPFAVGLGIVGLIFAFTGLYLVGGFKGWFSVISIGLVVLTIYAGRFIWKILKSRNS